MQSLKNHEMIIENFFKSNLQKKCLILKYFCLEYSNKSLPVGNT